MKIIFSEECLNYDSHGHPESSKRVRQTYALLKKYNFEFIEPQLCSPKDITLVHNNMLLEKIKTGDFFDSDTPNINDIYKYARIAAGGAILAAKIALNGEKSFALIRPPGHHATRENLGGFCYFNNVAIASKKFSKTAGKISIIDIDCHHGNGTQDIFEGQNEFLYISLHQYPLYPGTGSVFEKNCLNFPLPPGTSEKIYLETLDKAIDDIKKFNPGLIAISAGFDTYKEDPLTDFGLDITTYEKIASKIAALGKPCFAVLEGGYSEKLPQCVYQFLLGFEKC